MLHLRASTRIPASKEHDVYVTWISFHLITLATLALLTLNANLLVVILQALSDLKLSFLEH